MCEHTFYEYLFKIKKKLDLFFFKCKFKDNNTKNL